RGHIHPEPGTTQRLRSAQRRRVRRLTHPRHVHIHSGLYASHSLALSIEGPLVYPELRGATSHCLLLLQRQNHPILSNGEPTPFRRRPTEQLPQPVLPPASAHCILRTQSLRRNLKRRPHVIVQPTHQPPIFLVHHAAQIQLPLQLRVV